MESMLEAFGTTLGGTKQQQNFFGKQGDFGKERWL